MFEDFSFSSPSSSRPPRLAFDGDDRLMIDPDSTMISPMSSRCPSPRSTSTHRFPRSLPRSRSLYFRSPQQPPTSVPFSAYDHKRLSIGTLTKKLHEHTIQNPSSLENTRNTSRPASPTTPQSASRFPFPGYVLTPPDTDHDDEGYADSTSSPLTSLSPSLSPQPQSPFLSPTSAPADYPFPPPGVDQPDPYSVRSYRQQISLLQCNPSDLDAIRDALLADEEVLRFTPITTEDCHPSSLPPQQGPRRRTVAQQRVSSRIHSHISSDPSTSTSVANATSGAEIPRRRKSSTAVFPSHRIEKSYHHHHGHVSSSRELHKKSEQGLRRKSLVSAALASMIDRTE